MNQSTILNSTWEDWYTQLRIYARSRKQNSADWKFWKKKYDTGITPIQAGIAKWST